MSLYGFLIGIAFVIGFQYFSLKNKIIPKSQENTFIFLLFLFSIIGARIYSVVDDWSFYSQNLIQVFNTRGGGLGIFGGLIGGLVFIYFFSKKNRLDFIQILNMIAPIIPFGQSLGRWGNFVNKEVFGLPTYVSFGQYIPQNLRPIEYQSFSYFHPVWFYESVLDLILGIILINSKKDQFAKYLIGYGVIRFFMEFFRWDTFTIYNVKVGQILGLLFITIGLVILKKRFWKHEISSGLTNRQAKN
jgi:phosphatidylglycerol:prolipoprotein diacylglycerol transferase